MDFSELQQIYADYERALAQAHKKSSVFAGLFGQGSMKDPRSNPCNQEFYDKCEAWVKDFAATHPSEEAAMQVCRWILEAAEKNRNRPVYWYYLVTQSHVRFLTDCLSRESRIQLASEFDRQYPKRARLPIQEEVWRCLNP